MCHVHKNVFSYLLVAHLMLKAEFWPLVLKGKKRITIRKRTRLKPGDEVLIHAGGKIVGRARIKRVYKKKVDDIGEEEAEKEGMDVDTLRNMIRKLYGGGDVYVIEFELENVFDPPIDPEELAYRGENPVDIAKRALSSGLDLKPEEKEILELVVKTGSLRKAALLLGGLEKRKIIRRVLRSVLRRLSL